MEYLFYGNWDSFCSFVITPCLVPSFICNNIVFVYLGASAVSAFFAAACSVPVKNVLAHGESGSYLDCALKILKSRGSLAFFTGFSRQFALVGPPIMILLAPLSHIICSLFAIDWLAMISCSWLQILWFVYDNIRRLTMNRIVAIWTQDMCNEVWSWYGTHASDSYGF